MYIVYNISMVCSKMNFVLMHSDWNNPRLIKDIHKFTSNLPGPLQEYASMNIFLTNFHVSNSFCLGWHEKKVKLKISRYIWRETFRKPRNFIKLITENCRKFNLYIEIYKYFRSFWYIISLCTEIFTLYTRIYIYI